METATANGVACVSSRVPGGWTSGVVGAPDAAAAEAKSDCTAGEVVGQRVQFTLTVTQPTIMRAVAPTPVLSW